MLEIAPERRLGYPAADSKEGPNKQKNNDEQAGQPSERSQPSRDGAWPRQVAVKLGKPMVESEVWRIGMVDIRHYTVPRYLAVVREIRAQISGFQEYQPDRTEDLSRSGSSGNGIEKAISLFGMIQAS